MPESTYYLIKELRLLRRKVKFMFYKARLADLVRVLEAHIQVVVHSRARGGLSSSQDTPSKLPRDLLLPLTGNVLKK